MEQTKPVRYTDEQLHTLAGNAYVKQALPGRIVFTAEFKKLLKEAVAAGRKPEEVFSECGIDPAILGPGRIGRLVHDLGDRKDEGERRRFVLDADMEDINIEDIDPTDLKAIARLEETHRRLKKELACLKEELDLLQKLAALNEQAAERHRQKQRRKRKKRK